MKHIFLSLFALAVFSPVFAADQTQESGEQTTNPEEAEKDKKPAAQQ